MAGLTLLMTLVYNHGTTVFLQTLLQVHHGSSEMKQYDNTNVSQVDNHNTNAAYGEPRCAPPPPPSLCLDRIEKIAEVDIFSSFN